MTANLQTLIASAQQLSFFEQVELIRAVSRFLSQNYRMREPEPGFWQPQTLEDIIQTQQTQPVQDISALQVDFWPEQETADDFIDYIYQQRKEDGLRT